MLFLVGNKCDMDNMREVNIEQILEFKASNNILYFCETSAKSGKNIERLFTDTARFIYTKYKDKFDRLGELESEDNS